MCGHGQRGVHGGTWGRSWEERGEATTMLTTNIPDPPTNSPRNKTCREETKPTVNHNFLQDPTQGYYEVLELSIRNASFWGLPTLTSQDLQSRLQNCVCTSAQSWKGSLHSGAAAYAFLAFIAFMAFFGAAAAAFAAFLAIFALKIKRGNLKNAKVTQDKLLEQYLIYVHVILTDTGNSLSLPSRSTRRPI